VAQGVLTELLMSPVTKGIPNMAQQSVHLVLQQGVSFVRLACPTLHMFP
jgi:hypothetical protein